MKRNRRVPRVATRAARTEFVVNLNIMENPTNDLLVNVPPLSEESCSPEWERRARGLRLM